MPTIRPDLTGVVVAPRGDGTYVTLAAGDPVPDGVTVDTHVLADPDETTVDTTPETTPDGDDDATGDAAAPPASAPKAAWLAYAQGLELDVDGSMSKAEIQAAVAAASQDDDDATT